MSTASISPETAQLHALLLLSMDDATVPNPATIKALLEAGADVNAPDFQGLTPLLRCLSWKYDGIAWTYTKQAILSLLLFYGADLSATTPDGTTAQTLASRWDDNQLAIDKLSCETLRRSDPILMAEITQICPNLPKPATPVNDTIKYKFVRACEGGTMDNIRYFLHFYPEAVNWQADIWDKEKAALTGLMATIRTQEIDVATLLLARGADVNAQTASGMTALHLAVKQDGCSAELIDLLIQAGADEKLTNQEGVDALTLAQQQDNRVIATTLLAALEKRAASRHAQHHLVQSAIDNLSQRRAKDGNKFKLSKP